MKKILLLGFITFWFLTNLNVVHAGFGIAPPYVNNENLLRGSTYKAEILLIRGDAPEALNAEVTINVPGADQWISIDKGNNFVLPKGQSQIPITVIVKVPNDAAYGNYKGNLRIKTSALNPDIGKVNIALGAQIDVDLDVIKGGLSDFKIQSVGLNDTEEGRIIEMWMKLENTGSIETAPSKVTLDIYSQGKEKLLTSLTNYNNIDKVALFQTKKITAAFKHQLPAGSYLAYFKIFNKDKLVKEGELTLSILPEGTLPPTNSGSFRLFASLGLANRSIWFYCVILVILIIIIAALIILSKKLKRRRK